MNLLKKSVRFIACSFVRSLLLLFPFTLFANGLPETNNNARYCDAPEGALSSINNSKRDDLFEIRARGMLRVLLHKKNDGCAISYAERRLLEEYANVHGLELRWTYVENDWELLPELVQGRGDIIVAQDKNLSAHIQDHVTFAHTWSTASFKIVERADKSRIRKVEDLIGRQVAVYKTSPVWDKLLELTKTQAGLSLKEIPPGVSFEEVMQRVQSAEYDLAIADSLLLDKYLPLNTELQASFSLSEQKRMAWAVNSDAQELHRSLNQYLDQQYLTHNIASVYFEDLPLIKERGILRVITNANPSHYYLHKGKLLGFEYELLRQFATQHKLRLDVVLADSQEEMFQLLQDGKGDVIAASLPGNLLQKNDVIQYSLPYNYASPVIVGREGGEQVVDLRDLNGRKVTLSEDSPYWDYMLELKKQGIDFELVQAETGINMEATLKMVSMGMYDLTVVGNHQLTAGRSEMPGLKAQFILSEPQAHRWAVRVSDKQLFGSLNRFIETEYRSSKYNVTHAKYFEQPQIRKKGKNRFTVFTSLSPYDAMTQQYADKYGFDWRLITALMFQESQFDPNALSYAGAEGLMQLIPATAELLGVSDTNNPEMSINGGIRYLNYLRGKFDDSVLLQDRMWFAVASYNAGYGRVKRARVLAGEMGLDKNQWFDNVEIAMLGLAEPYYKDGEQRRYCRCGQTVIYVREIRTRYFNYIRLMESQKFALHTSVNNISQTKRLN